MKRALIIVDLQNDFMPGGALEVPQGDQVVSIANTLQSRFDLVVATKDWHPSDHGSFAINHPGHKVGDSVNLAGLRQILWPPHCVQDFSGSEFVSTFNTERVAKVFYKGTDSSIDSYSTFFDNAHRKSTGLEQYLKQQKVDELYFLGLATDYCVKYSVLDACQLGFKVFVIADGCRGVNLMPDDSEKAFIAMQAAGAHIIQSSALL